MKIAVINAGGTISCVGSPLAPMPARDFALACVEYLNPIVALEFPGLEIQYLEALDFPESSTGTLDSTNLQPSDWCRMAVHILEQYEKYDAFVLLHGTDSLDFTASALPFLLSTLDERGAATARLSKPVILTGSQVPLFRESGEMDVDLAGAGSGNAGHVAELSLNFNTDAYQNFCGAIAAAHSGVPEVCLFFENKLYRGCRVMKTNSHDFDAFSSPNYPVLAEYGIKFLLQSEYAMPGPVSSAVSLDNKQTRERVLAEVAQVQKRLRDFPVIRFSAFPAYYDANQAYVAQLLDAIATTGMKGLVLESYGEGNFPSGNPDNPEAGAIYQALERLSNAGTVIIDCTQVMEGSVQRLSYAAGSWLNKIGAIPSGDMTPMACLAKLTVLLASAEYNKWTPSTVEKLLHLNLCGERGNCTRLDSRSNALLMPGQQIASIDGSAMLVNDPKKGPLLLSADDRVLWSPLHEQEDFDGPGRLTLSNDGDLVFYSRDNRRLWRAGAATVERSSCWLSLEGSFAASDLKLLVYDYAAGTETCVLYQQ